MNDPYKWLTDFLKVRERTSPLSLRFIIPAVFERYFLFHPNYGIIDEFPFEEYPVDKSHIENLNKRHEIEQQYGLFLRNNSESLYRPVSLRELAARFHTDYDVEIIWNIRESPGISPLWERTVNNLTKFISLALEQEPLCFYIEDPYTFTYFGSHEKAEETKNENDVENIQDYVDFQKRSAYDSCTHLFGKQHPWCLTTFEDFPYIILSCDNETAEKLVLVDGLEYFETTIDYKLQHGVFENL